MDFLYQIVIYPIQLFIEIIYITLYHSLEHVAGRSGYAIIGVSLAVSFFTLPMYIKAEKLQDIQRKESRDGKWNRRTNLCRRKHSQ